jgi:hypothetical protein
MAVGEAKVKKVRGHAAFNAACRAVKSRAIKAGFVVPAKKPWKALREWAAANGVAWPTQAKAGSR